MVYDLKHEDEVRKDGQGLASEGGSSSSAAANNILAAERQAAAGKGSAGAGGTSPSDRPSQGGGRASPNGTDYVPASKARDDLNGREGAKLYKPGNDDGGGSGGGPKKLRNSLRMRKNVWLAGLFAGIVGGGGGFALFGQVSGPLQFLHLGELLKGFHWASQEDQGTSRLLKNIRNIRYFVRGEYERSRMGLLGNYMTDRIEAKMNARGFRTSFDGAGNFTGYIIDPNGLSREDHPDLRNRDPETVRAYFQDRYGVDVELDGNGNIRIPPTNRYGVDRRILLAVLRDSGWTMVSPLSGRTMGVRTNAGWHWMKRLTGENLDAKYRAWVKKQYDKLRGRDTTPPRVNAQDGDEEQDRPPGADEGRDAIEEIQQQGEETAEGLPDGDTEAQERLRDSIRSRITPGGAAAGVLGILCALAAFAERIDDINQANVILPMIRMAVQAISMADQVKSNVDVDTDQLGFMSDLLYDKQAKNVWSDAKSVQAEMGKPMSGPDITPDAKLDPEGNIITRIVNGIPGLRTTCDILEGALGFIITGVLALISPIQTIVSLVLGAVFSATLGELIVTYLANIFSANVISPLSAGAARGNFMNYGGRLSANDMAMARGGLPLNAADALAVKNSTKENRDLEFGRQNLAYRLFDPYEPRSLFAQFIDQQAPDPSANVARVATSFLNIGQTFGSMLASVITKPVGAAPERPYDYGFPEFAYSPSEMNDPNLDNPAANADETVRILDANLEANAATTNLITGQPNIDNYAVRAKECFGVDIVKENYEGENGPVEQYRIAKPVTGEIPTTSYILDAGNKCLEGHDYAYSDGTNGLDNVATTITTDDGRRIGMRNVQGGTADWTRVRMFIFDSQTMNSVACYEGVPGDDLTDQACCDIGMESCGSSGSGRSGPVTRQGTQLLLNGQPWKFAGVNADTWFGCWDNEIPSDEQLQQYFSELNPNSLTRIWPYGHMSDTGIMDRIVAAAHRNNQYLMVTLFDGNDGQCGTQPIGNVEENMASILPFIRKYAKGVQPQNDAIAAWELSNESCNGAWFNAMAPLIKAEDGGTLISTGSHAAWCYEGNGYVEAHRSEAIDLISMHEYDANTGLSPHAGAAAAAARELNKPWFVGEDGFCCNGGDEGQEGNAQKVKEEWQAYLAEPESAGMLYWDFKLNYPDSATMTFGSPMWQAAREFRHQYNQ